MRLGRPITLIGFALTAALCVHVHAADGDKPAKEAAPEGTTEAEQKPIADRRGRFTATFTRRSPHSALRAMAKRLPIAKGADDYELADQTFDVFVPETYEPTLPHALVVWLNDTDDGRIRADWVDTLGQRHAVCVGVNKAGGEQPLHRRLGLALDAAAGARRHFTIDPDRVYIIGYQRGGIAATILALHYPDVFTGGAFFNGTGYFRSLRDPEEGGSYNAAIPMPPRSALRLAATRSRLLVMAGDKAKTKFRDRTIVAQGYKKDGFKFAQIVGLQNVGDQMAKGHWFTKAILEMDLPLVELAPRLLRDAKQLERRPGKQGEAMRLYAVVLTRAIDNDLLFPARQGFTGLTAKLTESVRSVREAAARDDESGARAALAKLRRDWAGAPGVRWDELELVASGNAAATTSAGRASTERAPVRPGTTQTPREAAPPTASPREAADAARAALAQKKLDAALALLKTDLVAAYGQLESIARRYKRTPAGDDAELELRQLRADPEKFKVIQQALADREAKELLTLAKTYLKAGNTELAHANLRKLIEKHPKHRAAIEARLLLEQ